MNPELRPTRSSGRLSARASHSHRLLGVVERLEIRALLTALSPWKTLTAMPAARNDLTSYIQPRSAVPLTLDHALLADILDDAPLEFTAAATNPLEFSIPMPDGSFDRFAVLESPIMEPGLAAKFPDIKTYRGQGIDDPTATVRFDVTPAGFHAQILSPDGAFYVDPYYHLDTSVYVSYAKRDLPNIHDDWTCLVAPGDEGGNPGVAFAAPPDFIGPLVPGGVGDGSTDHNGCGCSLCQAAATAAAGSGEFSTLGGGGGTGNDPTLLKSGTQLRTYRTVVAATGEYTAFHGGTVALGQAAIVTAMNRLNQVYESELAIRMVLVANNNLVVYTNSATDPYSNNNGVTMLSQNQTNLDAVIGNENYDIGHVFSTGGGGVATLGSVGVNSIKARGVTGLGSPIGDAFYIDYVAHEMGHQYGANHTFNTSSAGGNRNASTAYEPGSGSTIMGYAGITGANSDLQPNSDPYFHFISLQEILNHVDNVIPSVGTRTATGNTAPSVNAGLSTHVIPANTPFELTATGSDPNGDTVTYSWEQRDLGAAQLLNAADNGASPLFRVWNPTTNPTRTFPRLSNLLDNTLPVGEKLPTVNRAQMKFRVVARDNRSGGGGIEWSDMFVQVVNTGAAFTVSSPNTAVNWTGGSSQTITWNVAGTTAAPINAANVNIRLSTDGGQTFPIYLASGTANDGSEAVTIPNLDTTLARIRVEAAGSVFFDLSNANFTISSSIDTTPPTVDIVDVNPDPRNSSVASIAVNFSESVTGFDLADLTLTRDGVPVPLTGASLGGGPVNFTLSGLAGLTGTSGTYLLTLIASGSGIVDAAGNPLSGNASDTWAVDTTPPTVDIVDVNPDPRNSSVASIAVNFSESVTGFDLADLTLTRDGVPVPLTGASLGGGPVNFTLSGLAGLTGASGTYVLTLNAAGSSITDTVGNALAGNALDTWNVDATAPTADIVDVSPDPRNISVAAILINFSESVTGFDLADLILTRDGVPVPLTGASLGGGPTNYALNGLSSLTSASGTYVLMLNAAGSGIADGLGNPLAGNASDTWTVDATAPTADIVDVSPDPRNSGVASIAINFSEGVTGFDLADLTLTRDGVPIPLTGASLNGGPINFTLDGLGALTSASGTYVLTLTAAGSGITDGLGNPLVGNAADTWVVSTTAPTADVVDVTPDPRNTSVASITINFSQSVTGFDLADLSLTRDGTPIVLSGASLSGGPSSYTLNGLAALTGASGTYVLTLNAAGSGIVDGLGNPLSGNAADTWVVDATAPSADIVDVSPDPRTTSVASIAINFSESVTGFDLADLSLTRDGTSIVLSGASLSGGPVNFTLSGLASLTGTPGTYVLTLNAAGSGIVDGLGNPLVANASDTWVVNSTSSSLTADIVDVTPDPRTTAVSSIQILFSQPVTGFNLADLSLTRNGVPVSLASAVLTGSGDTYFLKNLSSLTGAGGTYVLSLTAAGSGIVDGLGNPLAADASDTWLVGTATLLTADVVDVTPDPRNTSVASVQVVFSQPVTGFDLADLTLTRDGSPVPLSGASLSGGPTSFTLNGLAALTGASGTYVLTLNAAGSGIVDGSSNPLSGNASDTWTVDATAPTADIVDVSPDPRNSGVASIAINFSEGVTGFDLADLTLTRDGVPIPLTGASLNGGPINFTLDGLAALTGASGTYVLTLNAAGSGIVDGVGNPLAGNAADTWTVNTTALTVDIVDVIPDPRNSGVASIAINFSESVTGFDLADLNLTRDGVPIPLTGASLGGGPVNFTLSGLAALTSVSGTYVLTLNAAGSGIANGVGTPLSGSAADTWVVDANAPTADIVDVTPDPRNTSVASIAINFSESVTGFDLADLSLTRDGVPVPLTGASLGGGPQNYTLGGLAGLTNITGTYVLTLNAAGSGISDLVGNLLTGNALDSWVIDITVPTVDIVDVTPDPRTTSVASIAINFSESVTGFDLADLTLTRDGVPIALTGASLSGGPTSYTLNGLSGLTGTPGTYVLTLNVAGSGIVDGLGNALAGNASDTWVVTSSSSSLTADIVDVSPDPRTTAVSNILINFSQPVTGFNLADLSLTRNGVPVSLSTAVLTGSGNLYYLKNLSSLTAAAGTYVLTLTAAGSGIVDGLGNPLAADASDTWVVGAARLASGVVDATFDPDMSEFVSIPVDTSPTAVDFDGNNLDSTLGPLSATGETIRVPIRVQNPHANASDLPLVLVGEGEESLLRPFANRPLSGLGRRGRASLDRLARG